MIELIAIIVLSFYVGWFFGRKFMFYQVQSQLNAIYSENLEEELIPTCFIEKQNDSYFMYDADTQLFLAKDKTIDGLAEQAKQHLKIDSAIAFLVEGDFFDKDCDGKSTMLLKDTFWFREGEVKHL